MVAINKDDLTDVLCAFLSPTRPYGYCFAYSGGAHKSLRGHFFFYETDLEAVGATMHAIQRKHANPQIYAVLCGRMTLKQKEIALKELKLTQGYLLRFSRGLLSKADIQHIKT